MVGLSLWASLASAISSLVHCTSLFSPLVECSGPICTFLYLFVCCFNFDFPKLLTFFFFCLPSLCVFCLFGGYLIFMELCTLMCSIACLCVFSLCGEHFIFIFTELCIFMCSIACLYAFCLFGGHFLGIVDFRVFLFSLFFVESSCPSCTFCLLLYFFLVEIS